MVSKAFLFFVLTNALLVKAEDLPRSSIPTPSLRPALCPGPGSFTGQEDIEDLAKYLDPCQALPDETSRKNCNQFLNDKDIPKDALLWTLKVYGQNMSGLKMDQCLIAPPSDHYSNLDPKTGKPVMTIDKLKEGIKNPCQVMINDTRKMYSSAFPARRTYYYLNFCTGEKKSGYFNLGTGTAGKGSSLNTGTTDTNGKKNPFANAPGKHTTVLGAFLTSSQEFDYASRKSGYANIAKELGRVPALSLFGLQNTNNRSGRDMKYLHVSPFKSSWGCPSLAKEDYKLIDELAENGPSLVVNYGPEEFMEDPQKCSKN